MSRRPPPVLTRRDSLRLGASVLGSGLLAAGMPCALAGATAAGTLDRSASKPAGTATPAEWTPPQPQRLDTQRMEVVGNELRVAGQPIRLIGVAVADPIYVRANSSLDDYRLLADDWGVNAVRISLHPGHYRQDRTGSMAALVRDVAAARAQGLWAVVDWHAIGFPGRYAEKVDPSWGLPLDAFDSDETLALDFWDHAARTFGADPGILFELWNEPVYDGRHWKNDGQHWPHLKALWQRLIAVIRRHSDNIVVASGGRWAHDLNGIAASPLADPRVVYAWHCYPKETRGRFAREIEEALGGLPALKPVLVTEWGFCAACEEHLDGSPESFGKPFAAQALEAHKLHSFAWVYSTGATPPLLGRDGTPNAFGRFVRGYIKTAWRPERIVRN